MAHKAHSVGKISASRLILKALQECWLFEQRMVHASYHLYLLSLRLRYRLQ